MIGVCISLALYLLFQGRLVFLSPFLFLWWFRHLAHQVACLGHSPPGSGHSQSVAWSVVEVEPSDLRRILEIVLIIYQFNLNKGIFALRNSGYIF